jgi:hypothetical protein
VKTCFVLENEDGSAIILAMILLLVVTVIGISAINTTNTEIKIFQNEKIYQKNFYKAEAAIMEAAQRLASESNIDEIRPDSTMKAWLGSSAIVIPGKDDDPLLMGFSNALLSNEAYLSANAKGIVSGASLDITSDSNIYGFEIYGYSREINGNVAITIGYKKRM